MFSILNAITDNVINRLMWSNWTSSKHYVVEYNIKNSPLIKKIKIRIYYKNVRFQKLFSIKHTQDEVVIPILFTPMQGGRSFVRQIGPVGDTLKPDNLITCYSLTPNHPSQLSQTLTLARSSSVHSFIPGG